MDGLTLLNEAQTVGLSVTADGHRLVVRGPQRLGNLARRLLEHKHDVMAALLAAMTEHEADIIRATENGP